MADRVTVKVPKRSDIMRLSAGDVAEVRIPYSGLRRFWRRLTGQPTEEVSDDLVITDVNWVTGEVTIARKPL